MNLAFEKIDQAIKSVRENQFDVESWIIILKNAQCRPIDEVREHVYESLVTIFSTGKFWKAYIEHEVRSRNYDRVEKLFQRCLMKVLSIDLWKTYLKYVKDSKSKLPDYKEKMAQAYDFALDKIGMDINAHTIWNDYVRFLKKVEAVGSFAENQKITALRKIYQRGIINPMTGIENFWKEYVAFETSINPILAEKMTSEKSKDYMNARRVTKEYEACTRGLNKAAHCIPPTGSAEEKKQTEFWQKYISWERSNPLKVEDPTLITKRVLFAYEQCFLCLGHHPNIWLEAALFLQESAKLLADKGDVDASKIVLEQAEAIFERCTSGVLTKCLLLHFGYADFLEQQGRFDKAQNVYSKFLEMEDIDPSLCYIQYMKFCRRTEGTTSARLVFKKAREDPRTSYQVYIAAALMEYYCTKDNKIAGNVFELGFKKFKSNPNYVLEYTKFLSHLNEDNNMRVLFERTLSSDSFKPEQTVEIWNKFLEFETNVGDLTGILKVEKRRAHAFDLSGTLVSCTTARLIDRYRYIDLYPCSKDELVSLGYTSSEPQELLKTLAIIPKSINIPSPEESLCNFSNSSLHSNGVGNISNAIDKAPILPKKIFKPDTTQMVPFKPKFKWIVGEHRVPGGSFPLPPAANALCQILPPPDCFQGPFVVVDRIMDVFMTMHLPNEYNPTCLSDNRVNGNTNNLSTVSSTTQSTHLNQKAENNTFNGQERAKIFDVNRNRSISPVGIALVEANKRIRRSINGRPEARSDDEEDTNTPAPLNDIYRQRQQSKM